MMWSIMKLQVQVASELHPKSKQKTNPVISAVLS